MRRIELDVGAAEPHELRHLGTQDVDDVGEVGVDGGVRAARLLGVVVRGRLLCVDQRDLERALRATARVRELLGAHRTNAAKLLDDHGPLEHDLVPLLVAERDRPPAIAVQPLDGVHEVAVEGVAAHLSVRDDGEPRVRLEGERLVHRPVFRALELGRADRSLVAPRARILEVRWAQKTSDDVAAVRHGGRAHLKSIGVNSRRYARQLGHVWPPSVSL